ncbi:MAG: hypothetical protein AAFZ87_15095, partial [Planctomycetota bacterium]
MSPLQALQSPLRAVRRAGLRAALAPLFVLSLAASCATGGAGAGALADGGAVVTMQERGQRLVLLSDGYLAAQDVPGETAELRRDAFYSVARENGLVKVVTDARMAELIDVMQQLGFDGYATSGATSDASIGIEMGGAERAAPKPDTSVPSQIDRGALSDYTNMKGAFVTVFNETRGYQNVTANDIE